MTLWINGKTFADDLFNELAYMDEQHEWDAYHERYQSNKDHLEMLAFEEEDKYRQDCRKIIFEQAPYISDPTVDNIDSGENALEQNTGQLIANSVLTCIKLGIGVLNDIKMGRRNFI